jgi:general stress protein 26
LFQIDDALKEFMEAGVAGMVGTVNAAGRPQTNYAWGTRIHPDGHTVDFFVPSDLADGVVANLRKSPKLALTVVDPVSYRSVQLKGTFVRVANETEEDKAWVARHKQAFEVTTMLVGDPPDVITGFIPTGAMTRFSFEALMGFDQTPGPDAGRPL